MKIGIISTDLPGFIPTMAEGLHRMLVEIGVESKIFSIGLRLLIQYHDTIKADINNLIKDVLLIPYFAQLNAFDVIIIVNHIPVAFLRKELKVEFIRKLFPGKPIILYDLVYLPNMGKWAEALRAGNPQLGISKKGNYGLERYDWYLVVSNSHEFPLQKGIDHPYSVIGLNLDDGSLYPEDKNEFLAIIDFEQPGSEKERSIQIQALEETKTEYLCLKGKFTIKEIREVYKKTCIFFIQFRESFGLPICELQACGSYIFTPYSRWCPSHWIKTDPTIPGPGLLTSNFIVYENNITELKQKIVQIKRAYDPREVFNKFVKHQRHFFYGDLTKLKEFIDMVSSGHITSESHRLYKNWPIIENF